MISSRYTVDGNARDTSQYNGHYFLEAELSPKGIHVQWNTPTCETNAVRFQLSRWTHKQFLFEDIVAMASNVKWKVRKVLVAILDRCVCVRQISSITQLPIANKFKEGGWWGKHGRKRS